ncbi:TIGR00282 family metallophosphoesterase [Liquorilactobacillus vini]|uniref:Metallophosphoesterase n=1 Tax=Liquorilactobacillus vini DSM 20605 TaxID=1133569 RepID=A0A0R2CKC8_9LACO|nr:TIGR00282 family metallophosphoesterase [Liquorilactobacillus vini]KRM88875.1 metallophosphoesterase [Liquorilactobacillus vini DSM 20605]
MRILFVGDIMGNAGQEILETYLPQLKQKYHPQATVVNGENATRGKGIDRYAYKRLLSAGADVITMGNHTWDNPAIEEFIGEAKKLIRPANFSAGQVPGRGYTLIQINQLKLAVVNLQGRVFMAPSDDPFAIAERLIKHLLKQTKLIVVDFHAETTSEKEAFSWYFDGKVSAVIGTHTHVQTNDARILPQGTAFLSDVGMTGPYDGILGMQRSEVIKRFVNQMPTRFEVDEQGRRGLGACLVDLDDVSGKAKQIRTIQINPDHPFMF